MFKKLLLSVALLVSVTTSSYTCYDGTWESGEPFGLCESSECWVAMCYDDTFLSGCSSFNCSHNGGYVLAQNVCTSEYCNTPTILPPKQLTFM